MKYHEPDDEYYPTVPDAVERIGDGRALVLTDSQKAALERSYARRAVGIPALTLDEHRAAQKAASRMRSNVWTFQRAFGVAMPTKPAIPTDEVMRLRLRLIAEEFFELLEASLGWSDVIERVKAQVDTVVASAPVQVDFPEVVDALADLRYVVAGADLAMGVNGDAVDAEVHRSNMAKVGGVKRADGKVLKPEGWTPPDIAGVLRAQGWDPDAGDAA